MYWTRTTTNKFSTSWCWTITTNKYWTIIFNSTPAW